MEHVVFLMQENRSFDHYFGTLRGVRGFADPHPVTLPSGRSVWHQPNGSAELLRFRPEVRDLGQATTCRSTGPTAFFRRFRGRRRRRARRPRRPARYARPLEYRYSGHLENGRPSISDPGMGGLV